jgi:rare lipoprotein A
MLLAGRIAIWAAVAAIVSGPAWAEPVARGFTGQASYYGANYKGRVASGAPYDPAKFTCAHKTLPFGTRLKVSNGGRSVIVVVNDRGPFVRGRVLDLSLAAAKELRMTGRGIIFVHAEQL